jgi:GT2 family glycosyltransferase
MNTDVSIVIHEQSGGSTLARCLAATVQAAEMSDFSHELLVVQDSFTPSRAAAICERFDNVRLLTNRHKSGFGRAINRGAEEATGNFLVVLRSDLVPRTAMVQELVRSVADDHHLFRADARTVVWGSEETEIAGVSGEWRDGRIDFRECASAGATNTVLLQGTACSFRRNDFLQLGGFCPVLGGLHWQVRDLSYLALKAGRRLLYNPKAVGYRLVGPAAGKSSGTAFQAIVDERDSYLFHWMNLNDADLLRQHLNGLPSAFSAGLGRSARAQARLRGLLRAMRLAREVAVERVRRFPIVRMPDRTILRTSE